MAYGHSRRGTLELMTLMAFGDQILRRETRWKDRGDADICQLVDDWASM